MNLPRQQYVLRSISGHGLQKSDLDYWHSDERRHPERILSDEAQAVALDRMLWGRLILYLGNDEMGLSSQKRSQAAAQIPCKMFHFT